MRCAGRSREVGHERERAHARAATRGKRARGRTCAIGERVACRTFARVRVLQRACAANGSRAAVAAHGSDSAARGSCGPDAIPRAAARHGVARTPAAAPHAVAGLRGLLDFWDCQRAVCLAGVRMVWTRDRRAETYPGNRFWLVVDDSRTVRGARAAVGRRGASRRAGVDETGALRREQREKQVPRRRSPTTRPGSGRHIVGAKAICVARERKMADYSQKVTSSFNERMRLNRVRRRKEKLRFWDELLIIPKWLLVVVGLLYAAALGIAIPVNLAQRYNPYGNDMFPDRKSTRLNSSHRCISYAVFCLKKKQKPSAPTVSVGRASPCGWPS